MYVYQRFPALATNTILYGPPGTGKTYHTVEAAVKAAMPDLADVQDRSELKALYEKLVEAGRIRFVTFHQSFSYEEFVEGLRASSEDGEISYDIEPGIFKQVCEDASLGCTTSDSPLEKAISQFIETLQNEEKLELTTLQGNPFNVEYGNEKVLWAYPQQTESARGHRISLRHVRELYEGTLNTPGHYPYVRGTLAYLKEHYDLPDASAVVMPSTKENYVLVIDEINRGNISKIFGELITLVEPSKRAGQPEALSVQLPYSKKEFSVPSNLHIIGTMNTADRSLALMDTALRRRFDFQEMMPDSSLLKDVKVQGVDIRQLLEKMNQRIEYLYDREHTLGHAFFMPLKELEGDAQFEELQSIFRNKVIPLLEEYFFEDWEKIRLVLGDNQYSNETLQFVKQVQVSAADLFGNKYQDDSLDGENVSYQLNPAAFENIEAYRKIAGVPKVDSTTQNDDSSDDSNNK